MEMLLTPEPWIALATLALLEIILGIDNIIFITIVVDRLPKKQQARARYIGLLLAMMTRIALLLSIAWIMGLTASWFTVFGHDVSGRDIILFGGGLFLLAKSTHEIHNCFEPEEEATPSLLKRGFFFTLIQIALLDIVFSLDSVITAVGLADDVWVMVAAIMIAVGVMMFAAGPIGRFVSNNPTFKMLALSFLILIGVSLMAEGMDFHIPKGYIYFAMAFSLMVEMLNRRMNQKRSQ
ncbi:membrane protein [Endozoicomonas montiporae]|uniref:Membrane protein n=1 Tax=Endozoicomonas montiporae TaxID=1027273 RepID=A0A081N7D9_9GAMM|nr:membrane protein [Endozoicomonas montiporae]